MIFNVPSHIQYIRNGLSKRFINSHGMPAAIIKTQTRRLNRGIYKVGGNYAVQRKRGVKAESDIRIVIDRIWEETPQYWCGSYYGFCISQGDARAEGNYSPKAYEEIFRELNPIWHGWSRWVFAFHVIEVRKMMEHNITAKDYTGICFHCKQKLRTNKENEQGYCEECWGQYTDEMDAMHGIEVQK